MTEITTFGPGEGKIIPGFASSLEVAKWKAAIEPTNYIDRGWCKTYGRVWYVDIEAGLLPAYHSDAEKTNENLRAIPGLGAKLVSIAPQLVAPDGSTGHRAKPRSEYWSEYGIVRQEGEFTPRTRTAHSPGGVCHADHEGLAPYPEMLNDLDTRAYSAVLCLELGKSGGHLRFWPQRLKASDFPNDLVGIVPHDLEYSEGSLSVFDSYCCHQILPSTFDRQHPARMIAGIHFLYRVGVTGVPYWEYWF